MTDKQLEKQSKQPKKSEITEEKNLQPTTYNQQANIRPGMTIKVHQKIKEKGVKGKERERIQVFEGIVLAKKHGKERGATITVRKISHGIGVEKIFPLFSPLISKIEINKKAKIRRAKLYYLRSHKKKLKETRL